MGAAGLDHGHQQSADQGAGNRGRIVAATATELVTDDATDNRADERGAARLTADGFRSGIATWHHHGRLGSGQGHSPLPRALHDRIDRPDTAGWTRLAGGDRFAADDVVRAREGARIDRVQGSCQARLGNSLHPEGEGDVRALSGSLCHVDLAEMEGHPHVEPVLLREDGTECGRNEGGKLCIKKPWPGMMRTMWGDHERYITTYFSMFKDMYFTGDGCRIDEDGDYWLMGRIDDVVNVSGHRLGTAEIESALVEHETVAEAAVVGYPHEIKGQGIFAYVFLNLDVEVKIPSE